MKAVMKLIIKLLCRRGDYIRPVKVGNEIYIIKIEKFVSNEKLMEKWRNAIGV